MRFGVFTAVKIWIVVSWVMTWCCLVGGYQCFGRTYHLPLHGIMETIHSSETLITTCKTTGRHDPRRPQSKPGTHSCSLGWGTNRPPPSPKSQFHYKRYIWIQSTSMWFTSSTIYCSELQVSAFRWVFLPGYMFGRFIVSAKFAAEIFGIPIRNIIASPHSGHGDIPYISFNSSLHVSCGYVQVGHINNESPLIARSL
jgi:hypothetical protein